MGVSSVGTGLSCLVREMSSIAQASGLVAADTLSHAAAVKRCYVSYLCILASAAVTGTIARVVVPVAFAVTHRATSAFCDAIAACPGLL